MKVINSGILTKGQEVEIGKQYLYTEFKFPGYFYGTASEAFKFIVEILEIKDSESVLKFEARIIDILKNKGEEAEVEDEFGFGISKSTDVVIWELEEIEEGLKFPETYEYVGPKRILERVEEKYKGVEVNGKNDVEHWIKQTQQKPESNGLIIATFVIDLHKKLLINDRHSEHVQCANGANVLSAGEIGFFIEKNQVAEIGFISNQSTGFCPSSKSWATVEEVLREWKDLDFPEHFEPEFKFSYCPTCQSLKIVKEDFFYCHRCDSDLYAEDMFQKRRPYLKFG